MTATLVTVFALQTCLLAAEPDPVENEAALRAHWRDVFDGVAADYKLVREPDGRELKLLERATYVWARSGPHHGTYGGVYVWTDRGNAEAVACFWRYPSANGVVAVVNELHSLSPAVLESQGKGSESWKPKSGLQRHDIANAPEPAKTPVARLQQMRALCRDFTAHSVGATGDRTELRLLPQPLYRYQSTDPDVVDGALFAFVCSVGTDPEVFLQLEARNSNDGPKWQSTYARFSHMDLFVEYQGQPVWQALRDADNPISHNADHTYWVFHQRFNRDVLDGPAR